MAVGRIAGWPDEWPRRSLVVLVGKIVVLAGFAGGLIWTGAESLYCDAVGAVVGTSLILLGVALAGVAVVQVVAVNRRRGGRIALVAGRGGRAGRRG